ncbi:MAG TPA: universal stress protein [Puia sp.]|nr:universal stress protein [Puia sp.]
MKPIIVATDFSASSVNAANYAADMAAYMNTHIILAHVVQIPATTFQVPMTEWEYDEIENSAQASLEKLQKELLVRTKNKINITTEIRYGSVEYEILKLSFDKKPFSVVVGRKAVNALQRFLMGSNTLRLIHQTIYPVLIIPEGISFKPLRNITIASDLDNERENVSILFAKQFLQAFHASLQFIYVNTHQIQQKHIQPAITSLQNYFADFQPYFHFIDKGSVQQGIADYLLSNPTDLLIVMPEKHSFLESLTQPSDSNKIILHSNLPILSIAASDFPGLTVDDFGNDHRIKTSEAAGETKQKKFNPKTLLMKLIA